MHIFIIFLAWAVVSGASAWSSSEVSCGSCGSECQKACGTRNFRACCLSFQRRRRSQTPIYSLKDLDDSETADIQGLLRAQTERGHDFQLPQILRSYSRRGDDSLRGPSQFKDPQFLFSILPSLLQESSEEDVDEGSNTLPPSRGAVDGRTLALGLAGTTGTVDDEAINRLVEIVSRHLPPSSLQRQIRQTRYSPSPSKIRK